MHCRKNVKIPSRAVETSPMRTWQRTLLLITSLGCTSVGDSIRNLAGRPRRASPNVNPVKDPYPISHGRDNARGLMPAPPRFAKESQPFLQEITRPDQFESLSMLGDGLVRGGRSMKFLIVKDT